MEFKGQVGQDKWVCDRLGYKIGGYFMDIGAYDGVKLSNTSYLDGGVLKAKIKDIMLSNGYVIDREDILCGGLAFEDWYVNKKLL